MPGPTTVVRITFMGSLLTIGGSSYTTHTCYLGSNIFTRPQTVPSLSLHRYDAHINIECIMSLAAAKYITKYTHKGPN